MRAHPELVAYDGAIDTELMRAEDGLVAKIGAEGVLAVGLADGRGLALKVRDGARARSRRRASRSPARRWGSPRRCRRPRRGADRELARPAGRRAARRGWAARPWSRERRAHGVRAASVAPGLEPVAPSPGLAPVLERALDTVASSALRR